MGPNGELAMGAGQSRSLVMGWGGMMNRGVGGVRMRTMLTVKVSAFVLLESLQALGSTTTIRISVKYSLLYLQSESLWKDKRQ